MCLEGETEEECGSSPRVKAAGKKDSQKDGNKANAYSAECLMPKIKLWHVAGDIAEVKRLQTLL